MAIDRAIKSSWELRSKKALIEAFIQTINTESDVQRDWESFVRKQKKEDLEALIAEEKLKPEEFYTQINRDIFDQYLERFHEPSTIAEVEGKE